MALEVNLVKDPLFCEQLCCTAQSCGKYTTMNCACDVHETDRQYQWSDVRLYITAIVAMRKSLELEIC